MDTPSRNVALLIDADNASAATIDPVLTVLAEFGTVNVRRAYGNWEKSSLKSWRDAALRYGIEPQQQFDLTKGKNATDMRMTIDAMDLLARGRIDGFGLMSSDSDFAPLANRIRQDGIPVYGFGTSRAPAGFRQACTRFIDVAALAGEEAAIIVPASGPSDAPAEPARRGRRAPAKPPVEPPAPAPAHPVGDALPPAIGAAIAPRPVDDELLKLLIDAYNSVKRDDGGYASLSAIGKLAGNRSSFDTRNYGYRRLTDLIKAVPIFKTEPRDGDIFVKRVR